MPSRTRAPLPAAAWLAFGLSLALCPTGPASAQEPSTTDTAAAEQTSFESLSEELAQAEARVALVEANWASASPGQRAVFDFQRRRRWQEHHEVLARLARAIEASTTPPDSTLVARAAAGLQRELDLIAGWRNEVNARITALGGDLLSAPTESLVERELSLTGEYADFVGLLEALTDDLEIAPTFGMDVGDRLAAHDSSLVQYAEHHGAALEAALEQVSRLRSWRSTVGVDTVEVNLRIAAGQERIRGTTTTVQGLVRLLDRREYPTAEYRALLVSATGSLTPEVLDTRVLGSLLARWGEQLADWARDNGGQMAIRLVLILLLVLVTPRVAGLMKGGARRALSRAHSSSLVRNLMVNAMASLVWLAALFAILSLAGIDLAPMLAGLGIAGFVVGFALQDTLANFASGIMIMVYRPFDVGDFVTAGGVTGEVKHLTLVSTVIRTLDNQRIIVPNGKVWGDVINNATAEKIRRVDLVFGISYSDDIDHARAVIEQVIAEDDRVLDEPAPTIRVGTLGESSVDLLCRPWCRTEDYWELLWHLTEAVKKRFDQEGITIPFPQRDVHHHQAPERDAAAGESTKEDGPELAPGPA